MEKVFIKLFPLIPIAVFVFALIRRNYLQGGLRVFLYYTTQSALFTIISYLFWINKKNNLLIINLNTITEVVLLTWMYWKLLEGRLRLIPLIFGTGFSLFCACNLLFIQGNAVFNSYSKTGECILLIIYVALFFYSLLRQQEMTALKNQPLFWISSGFLIYFAGSLFLFALGNAVIRMAPEVSRIIWSVDLVLVLIANIFMFTGLWRSRKV